MRETGRSTEEAEILLEQNRVSEDETDRQMRALGYWIALKFGEAKLVDVVGIITGVLLAVVGIIAAYIYGGQLHEMRHTNELTQQALEDNRRTIHETLVKMEEQINAAKDANALSRQSIIANQAASIVIESPRPTPFSKDIGQLKLQGRYLYFANVGSTPSGGFTAEGILKKQHLPDYKSIGIPEKRSVNFDGIMPGQRMPSGLPGFRTYEDYLSFDLHSFTAQDMLAVDSFDEAIEVSGTYRYGDGFGNTRSQPFCFLYAAFPRHVFPDNRSVSGGGEPTWSTCKDMRRYIAQAETWKAEDRVKK